MIDPIKIQTRVDESASIKDVESTDLNNSENFKQAVVKLFASKEIADKKIPFSTVQDYMINIIDTEYEKIPHDRK